MESIDDKLVEAILDAKKNPRISAWSPTVSAILRYLRKTTPEFSISNEARILLEESVRERYASLWEKVTHSKI